MNTFTENTWDSDKIGDKLSQQLFQQKSKKVKRKKNAEVKVLKSNEKKHKQIKIKQKNGSFLEKSNKKSGKKNTLLTNGDTDNLSISNNVGSMKRKFKSLNEKGNNIVKKNSSKNLNNNRTLQSPSISSITKSKKKRLKKKEKQNLEKKIPTISNSDITSDKNIIKRQNKKLNIEKIRQLLVNKDTNNSNKIFDKNISKKAPKYLSLRERMMAQLQSSRFRFLNETLYNNESRQSLKLFKEDPGAFKAYHLGYQNQVEHWPLNPLDTIINAVKKMPKDYVIADFGCGEAKLACSVEQKVHSIDLVAVNDRVTACDMAHTPLLTDSVNAVIFCLSLMGSNLVDYILEANRVLKQKGMLKIAEVESRFDDINIFIKALETYGFEMTWKDLSHNLFYFMDFKKARNINRTDKRLNEIKLKPCLYKKR